MKKHIPNALTLANLVTGALGILWLDEYPAAYFVWMACVFDFLDGFAARALNVASPIGKELDSLADVVSFGVLPSLFVVHQVQSQQPNPSWLAYVGLSIAAFSALRLAMFNVDTRQSEDFIGLPTPANAIFITSCIFLPDFLLTYLTPIAWGAKKILR